LSRCKGALAGVYFGRVGARGQMKLHSRNEKGSEYDFVYELE
jgi:hypothetical protein